MHQLARFAVAAALVTLALPAPAHASDPLSTSALGEGATLVLRPKIAGIEVSFLPSATAPRRWSLSLLTPRGAASAEIDVTFPPQRVAPLVVVIPRPSREAPDGNLRLRLVAKGLDLVGLVGPWLEAPRMRVFGDATAYAGTTYAPRVVVSVPIAGQCVRAPCDRPLEGASITAKLVVSVGPVGNGGKADAKKTKVVATASATTDGSGSAPLAIKVPEGTTGDLTLELTMVHPDGVASATQTLKVTASAQILLSTDKPLYQPGQALHLRLLAKDRGTGHAAGSTVATFAVFDAKSNKVFQKKGKTSPEGVFAGDMDIATLVNTGRWRITAKVGDDEVERTVEVKPYVLPKFKVELAPERAAYKPGDEVKGTVTGRYFFGEPLRKAKVELVAETFDVAPRELLRLTLALDDAGSGSFSFKLPDVLTGQPLLQGAATVQLTAHVTDTAGQSQDGRKALTVYKDALRVTALPEAGRLVPGVDNAVYFIVTTPDGAPAPRAKLVFDGPVGSAAASIDTDATGIAEWHVTPAEGIAEMKLDVVAKTPDGAESHQSLTLASAPSTAARVLLRPANPSPRAGDQLAFDVLVQGAVPYVFVDLIKDGQTLVTLSGPTRDGKARITTTLPPELAGTVLAHAYAIGNDMDVYADTRPLVVRAADELKVQVVAQPKPYYAPGEDASVELRVTDAAGHPVLAALGLWAVDEAVFALSELRPGMEQIFFLLEEEIMKPKVEIHGFEPDEVFFPGPRPFVPEPFEADAPRPAGFDVNRPARVLAAAAMPQFAHANDTDSRVGEHEKSAALWRGEFDAKVKRLSQAVRAWVREEWRQPSGREVHHILAQAGVKPDATRDWFGVPFRVDVAVSSDPVDQATLMSAGPDATWNTPDDMSASLGVDEALQPVWELQQRREQRRWRGRGEMMMMGGVVEAFGDGDMARPAPMGMMARREIAADLGGGGGGGMAFDDEVREGPAQLRQAPPKVDAPKPTTGTTIDKEPGGTEAPKAAATPARIRSYFPETLYVNPLVMTDASGVAKVTFPMADSITTWRLSALASAQDGRLGSTSAGLKVFQDFFVDIAFPASLTRKDQVTVPVAVYNYLPTAQTVELTLQTEGGLTTAGDTKVTLQLGPNEVKGVQVPLIASRVGMGRLTVLAKGTHLSDAVRREVKVEPDGFAVTKTDSGMVTDALELEVDVPDGAIEAATTAQLKLYPGMFAQVVDGLENMLQMPSGCFEQTSSTTFPNILVLRYLRDAKKSKPELEATALRYLQAGWQRLVTFEVPGGGFSWFGDKPANKVLTAYGVMEFTDMDKVYDIDDAVVARTRAWLTGQQNGDGSFTPDASHLHEESWGDMQKSSLIVSSYITWALAHTKPKAGADEPLKRGLAYLKAHANEADDAYVLGYIGMAFAEAGAAGDKGTMRQVLNKLAGLAVKDSASELHFPTKLRTATYGSGESATIEVTAMALRAFMSGGEHLDLVKPGLNWLVKKKDQLGNWSTTQATIQVLQAMIASLSAAAEPVAGSVEVMVNGKVVSNATYTPEDYDVVRFIDASGALVPGKNKIRITPSPSMKPMFALTATSYLPWGDARQPTQQAFDVKVVYDRTTLAKDDVVGVRVTVHSNMAGKAEMGIVDVAVPPGFEVLSEDLERAVTDGTLQRFTLAGRQIILYVPEFTPTNDFVVSYRVRARFPLRALSGAASAYEYYNPDNNGLASPANIKVN